MADNEKRDAPFPSASEDMKRARHRAGSRQTEAKSYELAYADMDFMMRDELRPVRLQLELLKPELVLQEHNIRSTIVVFGSARTPDRETAEAALAAAEKAVESGDADADEALASARRQLDFSRYYEEARRFARLVSEPGAEAGPHNHVIVTGGGPGIMEAANRGASEAGADSIGLNIVLPHEQAPNPYITPDLCFQFHYFALRKMHLLMRSRALVIFPGGFGTMDELFETLTLIQTGKIRPMPVLLFGEEYWRKVINFEAMVEAEVIGAKDLDLFRFVESAEEAWAMIKAAFVRARREHATE
ncbi:TIGR00730 family Rossman fold protein [Oceanibacterium hippocampi]|uniref:AMP nucleosidase n=1 Tax=Oceanibacterium hippocampi TaxID=745714 RepID=A0A1Y5S2Y2_9PROT|nr:TIGR00730 family Rossman fold protein [Oceanibacterium hippocampi]SLN30422.1 putative lysine decarboxylase [Oceanibacterium hippocampi]